MYDEFEFDYPESNTLGLFARGIVIAAIGDQLDALQRQREERQKADAEHLRKIQHEPMTI